MRPIVAVVVETILLAGVLAISPFIPAGLPFALYVMFAQLISTYLVHCPAHYLIGAIVGIRFRSIRLGRTTLAKVIPRLAGPAKLLPILTLVTERSSLATVSKTKIASMYAAGAVASVSIAIIIAVAGTITEPLVFAALAWVVAIIYLAFDAVFSPRSGDLNRARSVLVGS